MPVIPALTVVKGASDAERVAIATIRTLCMDAAQQANSGHAGSPMGMAPTAYVLADAPNGRPEVLLFGTGSEVALYVAAYGSTPWRD